MVIEPEQEELDYDDFPDEEGMNEERDDSSLGSMNPDEEPTRQDEVDSELATIPKQGAASNYESDEEYVMNNPSLRKLFNKLLDEWIKQASEKGESSSSKLLTSLSPTRKGMDKSTPKNLKKIPTYRTAKDKVVKSPSDTTIYAPALALRQNTNKPRINAVDMVGRIWADETIPVNNQTQRLVGDNVSRFIIQGNQGRDGTATLSNADLQVNQELAINEISDFVETLQMEHDTNQQDQQVQRQSEVTILGHDDARRKNERAIIEAEKFHASIAVPPGQSNNQICQILKDLLDNSELGNNLDNVLPKLNLSLPAPNLGEGISDDDFFHLICHVDGSLKTKTENGEFVDLDKLLPKDKSNPQAYLSEFERLEWVHSEGNTFLAPAKRQSRINSFRRWEQAFRIYATIYCSKHLQRSREIWQYISVINTAANAYVWDNVYSYDIIFRQLMQFNPSRS